MAGAEENGAQQFGRVMPRCVTARAASAGQPQRAAHGRVRLKEPETFVGRLTGEYRKVWRSQHQPHQLCALFWVLQILLDTPPILQALEA